MATFLAALNLQGVRSAYVLKHGKRGKTYWIRPAIVSFALASVRSSELPKTVTQRTRYSAKTLLSPSRRVTSDAYTDLNARDTTVRTPSSYFYLPVEWGKSLALTCRGVEREGHSQSHFGVDSGGVRRQRIRKRYLGSGKMERPPDPW